MGSKKFFSKYFSFSKFDKIIIIQNKDMNLEKWNFQIQNLVKIWKVFSEKILKNLGGYPVEKKLKKFSGIKIFYGLDLNLQFLLSINFRKKIYSFFYL